MNPGKDMNSIHKDLRFLLCWDMPWNIRHGPLAEYARKVWGFLYILDSERRLVALGLLYKFSYLKYLEKNIQLETAVVLSICCSESRFSHYILEITTVLVFEKVYTSNRNASLNM